MAPSPELSLPRRFARLALPNILANVTVPLVGLVDTAMLGHLPEIRFLAGVALGAVIFDYAYWSFGFLRMGTTGLTAQSVGRGNLTEAFQVLYRGLLLALGLGATLLLLRAPIQDLGFGLLSGSPGAEAAGREYFQARIWGAPATLANYVLIGWYLGTERARAALVMTVVGNVANVALDWLLIVELGWAAAGAGWATAASQGLMLLSGAIIALLLSERRGPSWRSILDRGKLAATMKLNRDILIRTLCLMSTFALFTNFSARLGTVVLAANTVLFRLQMLASYLIDGAAFATESLAGIFRGRGDHSSLRRLLLLAIVTGEALAVPVLALMWLFPDRLYRTLTSHAEVIAIARTFAPWQAGVLLVGAIAFIYDGLFIGLTQGRVLRNQMLVSTLVFFLPAALLAAHTGSNQLLWGAMMLFMCGRTWTLMRASRTLLRTMERAS